NVQKISGALRYSSFVRLASPEMELNDAGQVPLINDKSIRNNVNFRSLRPGSWYRSSFSMIETENHWTSGGMPSGSGVTLHTGYSLLNNWGWALTYRLSNPSANYCTSCARGGPAVLLDPSQFFQVNVNGDNRRMVIPQLQWAVSAGDGGRSWERSGSVGTDLRISSRFSTSLNVGASKRADNQQWIANYGHFLRAATTHQLPRQS